MNTQNQKTCYINNAYCGYYDSCEEISNDDADIISDDNEEEFYMSENETFVDENNEQYYKSRSASQNNINNKNQLANKSMDNYEIQPKRTYNRSMNHTFAGHSSYSSNLIDQSIPATSTPKKPQVIRKNQTSSVRRLLDIQPSLDNFKNVRKLPKKSNSVRNSNIQNPRYKTAIRRSKSTISMASERIKPQKNCFSANSTAITITPNFRYVDNLECDRMQHDRFNYANNMTSTPFNRARQIKNKPTKFNHPNASISSTQPLIIDTKKRNTAVISPIYTKKSMISAFEVDTSRSYSQNVTHSITPSKSSWLQIPSQSIPLCTLRTCATLLLVSGTISCLLCFHIMSERGKSYELTFSLISSFLSLTLGFPCFRFQQWQWLPNRNYVSGYIILSLFSLMQTLALWFMQVHPHLDPEIFDIAKGALCGISSLLLCVALLGVCSSYCCKYPPPDNRVSHGVEGFTV